MNNACNNFDHDWHFSLAEHIHDLSVNWTGSEQELLGFDGVSQTSDCINWLKAGRSYGPAAREFNHASWRRLDLPHDWSIEHAPRPEDHPRNGFHRVGIGWYRKTLTLDPSDVGDDRRVALRFDGIFRDATVFVNGHMVGQNQSGYIGLTCDISDVVEPGDNQIAVRVNATAKEGWFYEGAGIYRHVWLITSGRCRLADDSLRIDTNISDPAGTPTASIDAHAELVNDSDSPRTAKVSLTVHDPAGHVCAQAEETVHLAPQRTARARFDGVALNNPQLWSLQQRNLYTARIDVSVDGQQTDTISKRFGLRTIRFDADKGFFLNEQHVKLKGVCNHQDHAGVGMAIPDGLQRWRLLRLKDMGCNSIRTAHNPPTPDMLDMCDELGILVMDEIRTFGVSDEAVSQLERMVRRDRLHPSVIMWSLANEEMAVQSKEIGRRMYARLKRIARTHDTSRPFTAGINDVWDSAEGFAQVEDVHGINYLPNGSLDKLRAARPDLPLVVAEASSAVSTRGEYVNDPPVGTVWEYDIHKSPEHEHIVNWPFWGNGAEDSWKIVAAHDYLAGTYVWTGFDYRGEQSPYVRWPSVASHFGIMDLCGFAKDRFYYYKAWWTAEDVLHIFPHWTWPGREGEIIDVWAYSNCERIELFVNGESVGEQRVPVNGHAEWKVEYRPGTLEAVGRTKNGREVRTSIATAGAPHAIRLRADHRITPDPSNDGVSIVTAEVVDYHGHLVPHASNRLRFETQGPLNIIGLGNGDPNSHEPDKPQRGIGLRSAFHGKAQVILQTTDSRKTSAQPTLTVASDGLRPASLDLINQSETTDSEAFDTNAASSPT